MTDEEYIIEAIGLSDGWSIKKNKMGYTLNSPGGYFGDIADTEIRDALAAQLVRQADKVLNDWRCLELFEGHTAVRRFEPLSDDGRDLAACYGEGRSMNTIQAIVDSGVLQRQQGE